MKKKVSIIIPVYNGESRLEQCLKSIISQTERNIEIIIIDDGSTDKSVQIIDKYVHQDQRIVVLKQNNKGVSASRNKGIAKATGKYIMFVDADDELVNNAVEILCQIMKEKKTDIIRFEYLSLLKTRKKNPSDSLYPENGVLNKKDVYQLFIDTGKLNSVWLDFINLDFLKEKQIFFPEKYILGEDMVFNLELFTKAESIYYLKERLYIYYINPEGISYNINFSKIQKKVEDTIETYYQFFKYLSLWDLNTEENKRKVAKKILNMTHYELKKILLTDISKEEKLSFLETYNKKIMDLYSIINSISYPLTLLKRKKYMLYYYYHLIYWKLKYYLKGSTI